MNPSLQFFAGQKKKRSRREAELQEAIIQWLMLKRTDGVLYFAVPNGLVSDPISVAQMKAQGLLPGVADLILFIPQPDGKAHPFCLELKSETGRQASEQRAFEQSCVEIGVPYALADNIDEALAILLAWGALQPGCYQPKKIKKAA